MSGPKTVGYTVVETEADRRAREWRRLQETRRQLSVQRQRLVERVAVAQEAYGVAIDVPEVAVEAGRGTEELERLSQELEAAREQLSAGERALDEGVRATRTQALVSRLAGAEAKGAQGAVSASSILAAQRAGRTEGRGEGLERASLAEAVARVTGRLDARTPRETVERIDRAAVAVLGEEDPSVAKRGVDALRLGVQQANEAVQRLDQRRHELDELRRQLVDFPGPRTGEMLRALDALERTGGEITTELKAAVEKARSADKGETERRQVAKALKSSLGDLGYEVGEDFETLLGDQGVADAHQSAWRGYAVRVRSGADSSDVRFNVVREEAAGPWQSARDKEVEESWCSDFERLLSLLERRGVEPEVVRRIPAGTLPVPAARPAGEVAEGGQTRDEPREEERANP